MNTYKTFSLSFYIRNDRINNENKAPLVARVKVNGEKLEISTNIKVPVEHWKDGKITGNNAECNEIKEFIEELRNKIIGIRRKLMQQDNEITIHQFKDAYFGTQGGSQSLSKLYAAFMKRINDLSGIDYSPATILRHETAKKHVFDYLNLQYKAPDLELRKLNYEFVSGFEKYLKTVRNCNQNSTSKYIKNFRTAINFGVKNEWLQRDPFSNFTCRTVQTERGFLTVDELKTLEDTPIEGKNFWQTRDIFVFCCYTGLSFIDVTKLKREHIMKGIDGKEWININRTKTETNSKIPLLPKAKEILEKYKNHPSVKDGECLLPVNSNQRMNMYLKFVARDCEISKTLTFHMARHTFATTVTLTHGVPIETVSFMLGHRSIKTTQIYSKVVESKVGKDMGDLMKKMSAGKRKKK